MDWRGRLGRSSAMIVFVGSQCCQTLDGTIVTGAIERERASPLTATRSSPRIFTACTPLSQCSSPTQFPATSSRWINGIHGTPMNDFVSDCARTIVVVAVYLDVCVRRAAVVCSLRSRVGSLYNRPTRPVYSNGR